jgi:hypothetical protein
MMNSEGRTPLTIYNRFYLEAFVLHVLMPNGAYNGQKLIKLVRINIPARIRSTIATVPLIISAKYNAAITTATSTRKILSINPIFFFIIVKCLLNVITLKISCCSGWKYEVGQV